MSDFEPTLDDAKYPYEGIPLTAAIAQVLIRKMFAGKLVERQILADEVMRVHLAGGGLKASAQNVMNTVFRNALSDMKVSGTAENTSVGYWRIHQSQLAGDIGPAGPAESFSTPETSPLESVVSPEPTADFEVGTGPSAIYIYYLRRTGCELRNKARKHGRARLGALTVIRSRACCLRLQPPYRNDHELQLLFEHRIPARGRQRFTAC